MRARLGLAIFFLLSGTALAATQSVDPSVLGIGARGLSMGRAFTAVSGDVSDVFINPSGVAGTHNWQAMTMSGNLMQDLDYLTLAGTKKFGDYAVGVGLVTVGSGAIPLSIINGLTPEATGQNADYRNTVLVLSLARQEPQGTRLAGLKHGIGIKLFNQGFTGAPSADAKAVGFNLDLGLSWSPTQWIDAGLVLQNILPESLGGKISWSGMSSSSDGLPQIIKAGAAVRAEKLNSLFTIDSETCLNQARPGLWRVGYEWQGFEFLSVRLGVDQQPSTGGVDNNFTGGAGLSWRGWKFDYAYHQYASLSDGTTHYFSIGYDAPN